MASNGLIDYAKRGRCRICYRVRETDIKVKAVGEVRHGYGTGHIWECIDQEECKQAAKNKIKNKATDWELIKINLEKGNLKEWRVEL